MPHPEPIASLACRPLAVSVGLLLLALLSLPPLLAPGPHDWASPFASALAAVAAKVGVLLAMFAFIGWAGRPTRETLAAAGLAAALAIGHRIAIDDRPDAAEFQHKIYREILRLGPEPIEVCVPHGYRPLSYGFVRSLELATGDWPFSCLVYRWFFTFWFLWAAYRLAAIFVSPAAALAAPMICALYYPLSCLRYLGQLTDPVSHALFALGLVWIVEDRRGLLLAALVLGMLAKETAVILVPAYWACHWGQGTRAALWSAVFLAACTFAFLVARWPLGWRPGTSLNGVDGTMMFWANFAPRETDAQTGAWLIERWLHPFVFVVPFVPLAVRGWRHYPPSLRPLALTVVPLMIGVHVTMSWSYESRNYMPAVPVLAVLAIHSLKPRKLGPKGESKSAISQ